MNRRYLAALAAAAIAILALGLVVRRSLAPDDVAPQAPPSEAAAFQQLSQEGQLRRIAEFVEQRIDAAAQLVVYRPETRATGLRWRGDTIVSTQTGRAVVALRRQPVDSLLALPDMVTDSNVGRWVLAVGRSPDGRVVSAIGLLGGRGRTRCGERGIDEYLLGVPLHDGLAGAGLFALDGRLLGMAVRCGSRVAALPTSEIARLVREQPAIAERLRERFGFTVSALDDRARAALGVDSGLVVMEVRRDGSAARTGLRPGDVLLSIDATPLRIPDDLRVLDLSPTPDSVTLTRRRGTILSTLHLAQAPAAPADGALAVLGIDLTPTAPPIGVAVTDVRDGSEAAAAGLRPGDRLVRVGSQTVQSAADVNRLLRGTVAAPTFIVYARDSVERGVLLPMTTPRPR